MKSIYKISRLRVNRCEQHQYKFDDTCADCEALFEKALTVEQDKVLAKKQHCANCGKELPKEPRNAKGSIYGRYCSFHCRFAVARIEPTGKET